MFARTGMTLSVVIAIIVGCFWGGGAALGDPPPLISETYDINSQVDSIRYVDKAYMRNNAFGDFIIDFAADRTDQQGVNERWTVTFSNHATIDWVMRVQVDGVQVYSQSLDEIGMVMPVATIAVGSSSAEIDIAGYCADPDLDDYRTLLSQTQQERTVVMAVLEHVEDDEEPIDDPNQEYNDCLDGCEDDHDLPPICDDPNAMCAVKEGCCLIDAARIKCRIMCACDLVSEFPESCMEFGELVYDRSVAHCHNEFDENCQDQECP